MIRRCEWCKNGIRTLDAAESAYVVCALIPPTPFTVQTVKEGQIHTDLKWVRPSMSLRGWCGQHRLSIRKLLLSRGTRT